MTLTYDVVRDATASYLAVPTSAVQPGQTLRELGLDSIALIDILAAMEDALGTLVTFDHPSVVASTTIVDTWASARSDMTLAEFAARLTIGMDVGGPA